MQIHAECKGKVARKIRNSARTPGHAHLGANLWSAGKNSRGYTCTPNLKSVASSDTEILRGSRNFEIGHVPQATPTWGQFLVCGQEQPRIHVHTKFEECSFIRYSDIEGVPNFVSPRSLAPEPIRHKINRLRGTVEEYYGSKFQVIRSSIFFLEH